MAIARVGELHCPDCRLVIGSLVMINGRLHCHHGSVLVRVMIHNCPVCGKQFYWYAEEMEKKAKKRA